MSYFFEKFDINTLAFICGIALIVGLIFHAIRECLKEYKNEK